MITDAIIHTLAKTCHEVNRVYCKSIGDQVMPPWDECTDKQQKPMLDKTILFSDKKFLTPEEVHDEWRETMKIDGWKYGGEKDEEEKTHPDMLDYEDLPEDRKFKDEFFMAVIRSLQD